MKVNFNVMNNIVDVNVWSIVNANDSAMSYEKNGQKMCTNSSKQLLQFPGGFIFVCDRRQNNIISYYFDPLTFIMIVIFRIEFTWMNSIFGMQNTFVWLDITH